MSWWSKTTEKVSPAAAWRGEPDGDGEKEPSTFDIEAELLLLPMTGEDDDDVVISSSKIPSRIDSRVKGIILAPCEKKKGLCSPQQYDNTGIGILQQKLPLCRRYKVKILTDGVCTFFQHDGDNCECTLGYARFACRRKIWCIRVGFNSAFIILQASLDSATASPFEARYSFTNGG